MKSQEKVYVFLYSLESKVFDTLLTDSINVNSIQLKARLNTHRNLNVFAIKLTPKQMDTINKKINNIEIEDEKIFTSLNYCVDIGY